ncbi:OmpH family outer membrane protein [Adhaeribacter soli]|uniref:OmpH family outer membrane protein n=1 Tax=Adhaeribacter soli TaxID=2607655 RepID=A0A5N1J9T3_9BACT|nr:OmpH family outer membrane protein [Adhaeribacter soli]KAA9346075.1 OmpH family outer membrane protein [Adhaeribacter soli]
MKKHSLAVGLFIFSASVFVSSCNEKKAPADKTPVKTEETAKPTEETAPAADTTSSAPADTVAQTGKTTTTTDSGNAQKFGHINSADLIELMPETKKADASLEAFVKSLEKQFGTLQSDYRKKISEYQNQEKTMVDAVRESKIKAIQDLEVQMQQSQAEGQQKVAAKREALYKPILDKAEKAVKAVGKENGYDYIFDTNAGSFIYSKESHDIMPLVKKKLGIK